MKNKKKKLTAKISIVLDVTEKQFNEYLSRSKNDSLPYYTNDGTLYGYSWKYDDVLLTDEEVATFIKNGTIGEGSYIPGVSFEELSFLDVFEKEKK